MLVKSHGRSAYTLLTAGLCGAALYPAVARAGLPASLSGDMVHGLWIGVCLGLELLGVIALRNTRLRARP